MRDALVASRTMLINTVRGWMRGQGLRIRSGISASFPARAREIDDLPEFVHAQLRAIDALNAEIRAADERIEALASEDATCTRLMTIPGVGPQVALRFVAGVDDIARFDNAHRLMSYFGLVPGEKSSSDFQQRLSITKAGSTAVRWLLIQAAWALRYRCKRADARRIQLWAAEIEKRRGARIACVAVARKLAGIMFAIWRDSTTYEAN